MVALFVLWLLTLLLVVNLLIQLLRIQFDRVVELEKNLQTRIEMVMNFFYGVLVWVIVMLGIVIFFAITKRSITGLTYDVFFWIPIFLIFSTILNMKLWARYFENSSHPESQSKNLGQHSNQG